ncbi:uncharacterized protein METZ01_LOCUS443898 [marine metagenome]|uniref:Uncharacterized protein n=1 Tax=marine metagenome TaxID=408172 RepID=A0A382Z6A7_9ZZZZ
MTLIILDLLILIIEKKLVYEDICIKETI